MIATKKNIHNANPDANGLNKVARSLGYETTEDFLSDNPGAIEAIYEWLCEGGLMRDGTAIPDDEEEDEDEDESEEESDDKWFQSLKNEDEKEG